MTFDEAKIAIKENQVKAPYLSNWLHIKTGNHYIVKHHVILESNLNLMSSTIEDMMIL